MKWIESYEERQRRAAEKAELLRMAREDFARAKRAKDEAEKSTLTRDGNRRTEEANSK